MSFYHALCYLYIFFEGSNMLIYKRIIHNQLTDEK